MPNERIGLIGFAGTSYLYAPLTIDHSAVRELVDQVDETWAPLGGSDLASAVHLATETLKKTGQKNNALVILSDGEEHDGELNSIIAEAEQAGIYIIAVGVGTEDGGFVPSSDFPNGQLIDSSGRAVISRLQAKVMRKLAEETKGRFAIAGSGADIPALVKSVVMGLDAFQAPGRERRISIEFYQWILLPAIIFLIVSIIAGTRWKRVQTLLFILGGILFGAEAKANDASNAKKLLENQEYQAASDAYRNLAKKSFSRESKARYHLGEASAAYHTKDFRGARTAFSQSLMSTDPKVLANGHVGMGNSLFQLGWIGLSGEPYPSDPSLIPDLARFDTLAKEALAKMRESDASDDSESGGYVRIESIITNWADAVRHFGSAELQPPTNEAAEKNSSLAITYLKRLAELLTQEKQDAEQSMPEAGPGEGQPQEGDGEPQEGDGKKGKKGQKKSGDKGDEGEEKKDGSGDDDPKNDGGEKGKKETKKNGEKDGDNPNESPQQRARRILKENSDLEKGPLSPGRREFGTADKDW
jgi:Ca-activated chloride channel family protein